MSMDNKFKLLFLVTVDWYFWSHRLALARAARDAGIEVVLATRTTYMKERIRREGFKVIEWNNDRGSASPIAGLKSLLHLIRIYRQEKPDLVHHVSIKPAVFGGIAARVLRIQSKVTSVTGLGYVFIGTSWRARLLRPVVLALLRLGLSGSRAITVFQNAEDQRLLVNQGVLPKDRATLIPGSGVNVSRYQHTAEPDGIPIVAMVSRLLLDKGVQEFIDAADILAKRGAQARFVLVGGPDPDNSSTLSLQQLSTWTESKIVEFWGYREDTPEVMSDSSIVCLPSYREGLPKVLLEAAASGRAIIGTDVPGCRDVITDGHNGLLVPAKSSEALAEAIESLLQDRELRKRMGERNRFLAESKFADERIILDVFQVYRDVLNGKCPDSLPLNLDELKGQCASITESA